MSDPHSASIGSIYLYGGGASLFGYNGPRLDNTSGIPDDIFASRIQITGDLNGDGNDDLVACAWGRALVYYSPITADSKATLVHPATPEDMFCSDLF